MRYTILVGWIALNLVLMQYLPGPVWGRWLVVILAGYLLVVPLLLRFGSAVPATYPVEAFDPGRHDATLEQLSHLSTTAAQLGPLGFRRLGELAVELPASRLGSAPRMLSLVLEDDAGTRAVATALVVATPQRSVTRNWVELSTRFPTHVRMTTNYPRRSLPMGDGTRRRTERFPQLRDAALLAHAHRALLERDDAGQPTPKRLGDLAATLTEYMREEYERLAAEGYYQLDRSGSRWVPTFKGALFLAFATQWPLGALANARARRRASARLAELGLSALEAGLPA